MTLYTFNRLAFEDQLELVWNQGTFLTRRKLGHSYLILYAVDRFFVEVKYDRHRMAVTICRSFQSLSPLEPYLEKISIGSIDSV